MHSICGHPCPICGSIVFDLLRVLRASSVLAGGGYLGLMPKKAPAEACWGLRRRGLFAAGRKPSSVAGSFEPMATISLGRLLPVGSSGLPAEVRGFPRASWASTLRLFGLAAGGVCRAVRVTPDAVRSYRTISPLPAGCPAGGIFLLHFPSDCSALMLSSTVPRDRQSIPAVRTFLTRCNSGAIAAAAAMGGL
jgi:hypothetical protein